MLYSYNFMTVSSDDVSKSDESDQADDSTIYDRSTNDNRYTDGDCNTVAGK